MSLCDIFLTDRQRYVKARLEAINEVRPHTFDKTFLSSKTDALRAIKRFEKINKTTFNHKDISHRCRVCGCGHHERLFLRLEKFVKEN